ncbi:hypothetical protein BUALT_Bualt01G0116100 [Buddleja alternifolia]|uniref:Uncharacterized protein n=1 Tax=Buddleja alternifolia TaxID=168488 RepID=A0AAV6YCW0_9LAMI|nr:hypothetical protein BUALT_Bualt01G0116100 [Buddleja alternifolia]
MNMSCSLAFLALLLCLSFVAAECIFPVIFNFGDSNSDTGGHAASYGDQLGYPVGRLLSNQPTGRLSDGRLVLDFLCENLNTSYLTPYLLSLEPNFTNGANFAISGAAALPKTTLFNLAIQVQQFKLFRNRSIEFQSNGFKNLLGEEDFKRALYTIDIGQNDLWIAQSYPEVIQKIPSVISEIREALRAIYYLAGGKNFWVHNTGPLGCLPASLANRKTNATTDYDENGCLTRLNEGAKEFNAKLKALCQELRREMKNSTIVYVDIYSIKYDLIANAASYGFQNPLMACYGCGGPPYNSDPECRGGNSVCEVGSSYISWDGVHYTEAANAVVASKILSTNYSVPPLKIDFFLNNIIAGTSNGAQGPVQAPTGMPGCPYWRILAHLGHVMISTCDDSDQSNRSCE